jgi:sugar transferase (PEP-CTERM system associated)
MNPLIFACVAGDVVCALCGLSAAFLIRFGKMPFMADLYGTESFRLVVFIFVLLFSSFLIEIYDMDKTYKGIDIVARITFSLFISFIILSAFYYLIPLFMYGRSILLLSLVAFGLLQFSWHAYFRIWAKSPGFAKRVLILGTGPLARQIGNLIDSSKRNHVLAGYLNCSSEPVTVPNGTIVGDQNDLLKTAKREKAHKIVVSLSERRGVFPLESVLSCKLSGIEVVDAPSFYEKMTGKLLLEYINPSWFIFSRGFRLTNLLRFVKRIMDFSIASVGLLLSLPLLPIIALLVKLDSPGPVLFKQERVGEGDKNFVLLKFRTMRQDAENATGAVWAQRNDPRITRIGGFLRKSRLDEIPQIFNVLRGDMSLVGPRPERPEFMAELKKIIPYYSERHYFKPGVTGWAQVRYPYGASVQDALEKLRYDMYYIKNWSLTFDLMIMFETVKVMLLGRGSR